jgi:hypothetical protein
MSKIKLEVTDKQLQTLVTEAKQQGYTVHAPLKLLTILLQAEIKAIDCYFEHVTDGGGNALVGDVLEEDEAEGVVSEED